MKVSFSKKIDFRPKWGGNLDLANDDQFKVSLSVLDNAELLGLQEAFRKNAETDKVDTKTVMLMAKSLLPKYAVLENMGDDNGTVTIDDVANLPFYMDLALEIILKLAEVSSPTRADEKN